MAIRLAGSRSVLRPIGAGDMEHLRRWNNDPEINRLARYNPELVFDDSALMALYLALPSQNPSLGAFMIEDLDGAPVGVVDYRELNVRHGHCTVGIYIGEKDRWGEGLGSDALRTLVRWLFSEWDVHHIQARSASYNERAHRCFERTGFKLEGRLREDLLVDGERWDRLIFGVLRGDLVPEG